MTEPGPSRPAAGMPKASPLKSGNLLLNGNPGLGKTFLSACIARTVADGGYSVVYETAVHLFSCLEEAKFTDSQEAKRQAEKYTACDLLIVDDLGTEMTTQFVSSALYTRPQRPPPGRQPYGGLHQPPVRRNRPPLQPPNRLPPPGQLPVGGVCGGGHSAAKSERNIMRGHVNISKMPPDEGIHRAALSLPAGHMCIATAHSASFPEPC